MEIWSNRSLLFQEVDYIFVFHRCALSSVFLLAALGRVDEKRAHSRPRCVDSVAVVAVILNGAFAGLVLAEQLGFIQFPIRRFDGAHD